MSSANVKQTTDADFDKDVLKGSTPVIVDFWATWCAPCRAIAPVIDEIADQYAGKVAVYKVDIDNNPETPAKFGVRGIPTVILFKNGQIVDQLVGAVPKASLEELVKKAV